MRPTSDRFTFCLHRRQCDAHLSAFNWNLMLISAFLASFREIKYLSLLAHQSKVWKSPSYLTQRLHLLHRNAVPYQNQQMVRPGTWG